MRKLNTIAIIDVEDALRVIKMGGKQALVREFCSAAQQHRVPLELLETDYRAFALIGVPPTK